MKIILPRGTDNPALATSSTTEVGSLEITSCLGMHTLPTPSYTQNTARNFM